MVRNLFTVKGRPPRPTRRWRKIAGPGESRAIALAITKSSGARSTDKRPAAKTSRTRHAVAVERDSAIVGVASSDGAGPSPATLLVLIDSRNGSTRRQLPRLARRRETREHEQGAEGGCTSGSS